jgi:hypothetical protein
LACPPGAIPQPFRILIDRTHRAATKQRDRQDCWAYLLTGGRTALHLHIPG